MVKQKIAIIGVGHIAHALLNGWFNAKAVKGSDIILSDHDKKNLPTLEKKYGIIIADDNKQAVQQSDIIFIAVRPRDVQALMEEIKDYLKKDTIIVSIAACITFDLYKKYLGKEIKLFRIMPNIPATYNQGVVGWIANKQVTMKEKERIKILLSSLGYALECANEEMINKVSMISGSGPAYVAYFLNQLESQAKVYGFSDEQAKNIAQYTFSGSIIYMQKTKTLPAEFVATVATKGGITEEVIRSLNEGNFPNLFAQSLENGYEKIHNITKELKEQYD